MPLFFIAGALLVGLGAACGAFGAHTLKGIVEATSLESWKTASLYQMIHGLGLFSLGIWSRTLSPAARSAFAWSGWLLLSGIILFSGSIYMMVLLTPTPSFLGPLTPLGGSLLISGWLGTAYVGWRQFKVQKIR